MVLLLVNLQLFPLRSALGEPLSEPERMLRRDLLMESMGQATIRLGASDDGVQSGVEVFVPLYRTGDGVFFFYPEGTLGDGMATSFSLGLGYRHLFENPGVILGGNVFFDHTETSNGSQINQAGLGVEILSRWVDARANVYLPSTHSSLYDTQQSRLVSSRTSSRLINQRVIGPAGNGAFGFQGNNLIFGGRTETVSVFRDTTTRTIRNLVLDQREAGMTGMDAEVGVLVPWVDRYADVRLFGGYFYYDNPYGSDIDGFKGRVEVRLVPAITLDAEYYSDDRLIGSHWYAGVRFNVPFELANLNRGVSPFDGFAESFRRSPVQERNLALRIDENIMRQSSVRTSDSGLIVNRSGPVRRTQTNSRRVERQTIDATVVLTAGGDPITIDHVNSDGQPGRGTIENPFGRLASVGNSNADIVYIHADSVFRNETLTLGGTARILGEGGGRVYLVDTDQFGEVVLPRATDGNRLPQFRGGGPQGAIVLKGNSQNVQISGLTLDGGTRGIAAISGAKDTLISDMTIRNMTTAGIQITPSTRTTIQNVNFSNNATDTILNAEGTVYRDIVSNGSNIGLDLRNTTGNTSIINYRYTGNEGTSFGIRFTNPSGNIRMDNVKIFGNNGTNTGIGIFGGAAPDFVLVDSVIRDTDVNSILISGGRSNLSLNRVILDVTVGSTLTVNDAHGGSFTASNMTYQIGGGTGFNFTDADGTYRFNTTVQMSGVSRALLVAPASTGSFTFRDFVVAGGSLTTDAIDLGGSRAQSIAFEDVVVSGLRGVDAVDLQNSNTSVTMASLSVSGTGTAGSTAVDYRGASGNLNVIGGGTIQNVIIGFDFGAPTAGRLNFRNGSVNAGIPVNAVGLVAGAGPFDFTGTAFFKNNALATATGFGNRFIFADGTGGGTGTSTNRVTIDVAETMSLPDDLIVLVDNGTALTSTDGLTLKDGQQLIGFASGNASANFNAQAAALNILGNFNYLISDPTGNGAATLQNGAGTAALIDLADGNIVSGFDVLSTATTAVNGNGINGASVANLTFLAGGTGNGFTFTNTTGTIGVATTNVTNITGNAVTIDGGSNTINFGGNIDINNAGSAVIVQNRAGGAVNFTGTIQATGTSSGIDISGATAANTVAFSNDVDLGTSGSRLTGGTALDVDNNGIAGAQVNFTDTLDIFTTGQDGISGANGGTLRIDAGVLNVQGAGADGVVLNGLTSDVALTSINIGDTAGVGAGTNGITLTNVDGTFDVAGATTLGSASTAIGSGILIDGGDVDATFGAVTVAGRNGTGIGINGSTGAHTFGLTTISNDNSHASSSVSISNLTGGSVTFANAAHNIDQGAGTGPALLLDNNTVGFAFNGGTIQSSGGAVVEIEDAQGAITFNNSSLVQNGTGLLLDIHDVTGGNNILFSSTGSMSASGAGGGTRIQLSNNAANITIADATIASSGANDAVAISGGSGQVNLSNVDVTAAGQDGVEVNNFAGTFQFQQGSTVSNAGANGILVTGGGSTPTNVQIVGDSAANMFDTIGADAIHVEGVTGTVGITDVNATGVTGDVFDLTTTGTVTVQDGLTLAQLAGGRMINQTGTHTIADATFSNLVVDGGDSTINMTGTTTMTGANAGPLLFVMNGASGTINLGGSGGVNQANAANTGIVIDNASTAINFNTAVTLTGGGGGISVQNGATSVVTFNNAVNISSGANTAISMTSNGVLDFNAGLTVNTTSGTGINVTAGTLNTVTGSVTSSAGRAINLDGMTADVNLASISSSGSGTQGVRLNNVSGDFDVTGTTTVNNSTGDGILVAGSSADVSLASVAINNAGGDGVNLQNDTGTIEILDGTIDGGTGDGIDITNTSVTVSGLEIGGNTAVGNSGVRIATTGTARSVTLSNNLIHSANDGIVTSDTGAGLELSLRLNGSTIETDNSGSLAINIVGGGAGNSTVVNQFNGVTVLGNGSGGGIVFNNVTFDAVSGGGVQPVAGGAAQIGQNGLTRVDGAGLELNNVLGNLAFTSINVFNDSGAGLNIDSAPGTFTFANAGGSINTTNGAAVSIADTTLGATGFANLTSTNAANGILLSNITGGSFGVTGTASVTGATDTAIEIVNSATPVTIANAAASGANGLSITGGTSAGTLNVNGGSIASDSAVGTGVSVSGTSANVTFADTDVSQTQAGRIVQVANTTGGAVLFNNAGSITGTAAGNTGVLIDSNAGSVNLNNVTVADAASTAITMTNNSATTRVGNVNIDGGATGINIADNTALATVEGGAIDGTSANGIEITNSPALIDTVNLGTATAIGGDGIAVTKSNATSDTVDITGVNIGAAGGRGIFVNNTGAGTQTVNISSTSSAANGHGIEVSKAGAGNTQFNLSNSSLSSTTGAGLTLNGATGGGTLFVTGLADNAVTAAAAGGMLFDTVTFDADPGTAGIQAVNGGGSTIGATGDGLRLNNVIGNLDFATLGIGNTGGTGLYVREAGSGFTFGANDLDITTNNGTAMDADNNFDVAGGSVTSSGSATTGVTLNATSGTLSLDSLTVTNAGTTGVSITNNSATITLGALAVEGGGVTGTGVDIDANTGTISVTGLTQIDNVTGTAIDLGGAGGEVTFGDVEIDTAANAINLQNATGNYIFGDIDVTNVSGIGLDFEDSNLTFTAASFDMDGGTTAIDLTGTQNPLGANSANTNIRITNGGVIQNVGRGVDLSNTDNTADSAGANFVFGGGSIQATTYTVDAFGLVTVDPFNQGRYNFTGVSFTGPVGFAPAVVGTVYYVAANATGAGNGASVNDRMTLADANAVTTPDAVFVFINDGNLLDLGAVAFTLDAGQQINGFGNGNEFGLVQPVNVIGNFGNIAVQDPTGLGAATLTGTSTLVDFAGNNSVMNIDITGGSTTFDGSGASGTITVTNNSITQNSGALLFIDGGASNFSLSAGVNTITSNGGTGIRVINTTGGSVSVDGVQVTNAAETPLRFDNNAATFIATNSTFGATAGVALLEVDTSTGGSTGSITFDNTNTLSASTGPIADIGAGSRNIDLGAHNFSETTGSTSVAVNVNGQSGGTISFGNITRNNSTAANVISSTGQTGGTLSFGSVNIGGYGDGGGDLAVNLQGTGGSVTFADLDIVTTDGAGLAAGAITLNPGSAASIDATGGTALTLNGTTLAAGSTFSNVSSTNAGAGNEGIDIDNIGGTLTLTSVDVDNAGTSGIDIAGTTGTLNLGTVDIDGGATGINLATTAGAQVNVGNVTIDNVTGTALNMANSDGTITFADVAINTAANGIDLTGADGDYTFEDIDITGVTGVGLDFEDSDLEFFASTFDMTGGTTAIDLTGTTNPLGQNTANVNIEIANGGVITGVGRGVDLSNTDLDADSAGANFVFGGGSITATTYTVDAFGLVSNSGLDRGRYDFTGVTFSGPVGFASSSSGTIYYVSEAGGGDGSAPNNAITIAQADAIVDPSAVFVLVNDAINTPITIANTFTLSAGQQFNGFGNGNEFGLIQPINVIGDFGDISVTDPNGAATLQAGGSFDLIQIAGNNEIRNINLNLGTNTIIGSGFNNFTLAGTNITNSGAGMFNFTNAGGTVSISTGTGISLAQTGGRLLSLAGGSANFSLNAGVGAITNSGGTGIGIIGTTGGSVAINGIQISGATGTPLTFDTNSAAITFTNNSVATAAGVALLNIDATSASTTALTFDNTNTFTHGSGTIATIGAGARDIDLSAHNFSSTGVTNAVAVNITGQSGGTISFGNITRDNSTAANVILTASQTGGTLNFGNVAIGGFGDAAADTAVLLQGTGTVAFGDLDISTAFGGGLATIGTMSFNPGASSNISATGATAITMSGTAVAGSFVNVGSSNATFNGVSLIGISGAFSITGTTTISGSGSNAIQIDSSSASMSIADVDISSSGGDGVFLNGNTGTVQILGGSIEGGVNGVRATDSSFVLDNVDIGATTAPSSRGVDVSSSNGRTVTISNSSIRSVSDAIRTVSTAGPANLVLAVNNNTVESTGAGSFGMSFTGAGAGPGSTIVNSFAGNTVTANGTGGGILFDRITFDATTGGGIDQVAAGALQVGQGTASAQRVAGDGVSFINTGGSLAFTALDVFNKNGVGLEIDTTGLSTSFTFATAAGTVDTSTGTALHANTVTMNGTLGSLVSTGSSADGVTLDTVGGDMAFTDISVSGATGTGVNIVRNPSTHNFGTISVDGANDGLVVAVNNGAVNFTGLVDIDNVAANGIRLSASGGGVNFDDISVTNAITGIDLNVASGTYTFGDVGIASVATGIDLDGAAGSYTFDNIDITGLSGIGLDFEDANVVFTAATLDVTGTGSNATAINLTRSANPNGANSGITNINIVNGGNISAVARGVDMSSTNLAADSAGASFRFGGGSIAATTYTIDAIGLVSTNATTQGNYDFTNTSFTGNFGFASSAGNLLFVGDTATGAGDGSSLSDLAAPATADANTNGSTIFVMVNTGTNINVGGGFSLNNGQQINGFGNGNTFALNRPVNITGANIPGAFNLSHAGGAATVTGAGTILTLGNNNSVGNIAFTGGTTTISGTNTNGFSLTGTNLQGGSTAMFSFTSPSGTVSLTNNTINQSGGRLLDLNGGTATFNLTAGTGSIVNNNGNGIRVQNTTGGAVTLSGLQLTSADANPLNFDNNDATISFTNNTVSVDAGITLLSVDLTGDSTTDLVFNNTNTFTHTSGMIADIRGGARSVDLSAHNFTNTGSISSTVINSVNQSGGAISFGNIAISNYANATGTAVSLLGSGGTVSFGNLGISTTAGTGLNTGGITLSLGAPATISATGPALMMNGTNLGGGVSFTSISSTNPGNNNDGISLANLTNGTLSIGSATVSGATGATGDGIFITGTGSINFGNVDLDNNATGLNISAFSGSATFAQTGGQSFTLDGGLTGIALSGNTGTINIANADIGGTTVQSTAGILILGGTANIDITGSVRTNSTSAGISVNNLGAAATVDITNGSGTAVNVIGGRSIDIGSGNNAAAQITFGNVTTSGTTNAGLELDGSEGIITFGNVTIGNPAGVGINLNAATGDYTFGDVSITFAGAGRGIDFRDSNLDLDTNNLTITGNGAAGSIAMDLSGTQNANGNNSTNSNIRLADGAGQTAIINNVTTGVKLGDATDGSAGAYLVYGNQTSGSQINVVSGAGNFTIDTTNLTSTNPFTQGRYEFAGVTFTGRASFESSGAFYVGSVATGDGSGSDVNNLATYTAAESQPAGARIVLVARPGATTLNLNAGNPTWNLLNTQEVLGFGNGASITINAQPVNVIGTFQTVITDPFGQGALTVNGQAGNDVFALGSGNIISNFNVTGGSNSFFGNAITGLTVTGMSITGATTSAFNFNNAAGTIDINSNTGSVGGTRIAAITGGNATYTFDQSGAGSFSSTNGGFSIQNTTGGSFALTGGASLAGSSNTMVLLGNNVATVNLANLSVTGTGANLFDIDSGTDSTGAITITGAGSLTGGRGFDVDGGSRAINASGFNFTSANANTNPVVEITNIANTGSVSLGNVGITGFGTGAAQTAVSISGGAGTYTLTFGELDITTATGAALVATETAGAGGNGTLTVGAGSSITASGGQALNISNLSFGTFTLDSVASAGSNGDAININNTAGNANLGSVTISGVTNEALDFNTNTGTITITGGTITKATNGSVVLINSSPVTLTLTSTRKTGGNGTGISITSSTGAKQFGDLDITTTSGDGVFASGAGTIRATSGDISVTGGAALDITGTTVLDLALTSLASATSSDDGIRLIGSGVTGTATSATTSLTGATGHAISLSDTSATLTLNSALISGNGGNAVNAVRTGGTFAPNLTVNVNTGAAGAGIQTNAGTRILNVDGTTGGTITLNGGSSGSITGEIENINGGGIKINNSNSTISVSNFRITTPTGIGVEIDGGTAAGSYTFAGDITTTLGAAAANAALDINGTQATVNWTLGLITAHDNNAARAGTRAINITNSTNVVGGVFNFTDLDVLSGDSTAGDAEVGGGSVINIINLNGATFTYGTITHGVSSAQTGLIEIWDPSNADADNPSQGAITISGNSNSTFNFKGAIQINDTSMPYSDEGTYPGSFTAANGSGPGLVIIDGSAVSRYRFHAREDTDTSAIALSFIRMGDGAGAYFLGASSAARMQLDFSFNQINAFRYTGDGIELNHVETYSGGTDATGATFRLANTNMALGGTGIKATDVIGPFIIGGPASPYNAVLPQP